MTDYPSSIVWMIECRHWDDDGILPDTPIDHTKAHMWFAPVEPKEFGSGVVLRLEQLDGHDQPKNPPVIKNYILTCRHVVKAGDSEGGPVYYKEIICWKPGKEYKRTLQYNNNKNEGRRKWQMEGGYLAKVSYLSPHEDPSQDWALLEVDAGGKPYPFDREASLRGGSPAEVGSDIFIIGYPCGAGWEKDRDRWKEGVQFWHDGVHVENFSSTSETIDKVEGGLYRYRGDVESRPGMSGGGVFQSSDQALVGLHRSRHDPALKAEAVSYADIIEWLQTHRHVRPVYSETIRPPSRRRLLIAVAGVVLAGISILAIRGCQSPKAQYFWHGQVVELINQDGKLVEKPVDGATVTPLRGLTLGDKSVFSGSYADGHGKFEIITYNSEDASSPDIKLRIVKEGYAPLEQRAQAISDIRIRKYTLKNNHTTQ